MVYPAQQRFRTSIGLAMFSLVCFTMVVMACIAASTSQRYANFGAQSGGYDVVGQPLFASAGGVAKVAQTLRSDAPVVAGDVRAISEAQALPLIMIQPSAQAARWAVYPAATIGGAFLQGTGLPLVARSPEYASDAAVWRALADQPGYAVIDAGALSSGDLVALGLDPPAPVSIEHFVAPPIASGLLGYSALESLAGRTAQLDASNRVPSEVRDILTDPKKLARYALKLDGVATGPGLIKRTSIWVADPRGNAPEQVQIIGVVDNTTDQNYGLLASSATFAPLETGLDQYGGEFYLFELKPGTDARTDAAAIGSALLDAGFETTVIEDALLSANGPAVFASRLLIGLVGLTLLVGMAALAVAGTRAVVERRQQIGMLRALGYRRRDVRRMFVLEALFVAGLGAALGLVLGIILCRNVFAVSFFEQFQSGIALVIPWGALAGILAAALGAALLSALIPAQQASRVTPADALRYE
jgi:putative ABC transport system permease protein